MKIRDLEYLIALKREGTINKAAKACCISQQGFSRALDAVEAELGVKLVTRSHAGVVFTPEGDSFLKRARAICREYGRALSDIAPAKGAAAEEKLHVTISSYAAQVLFERVMGSMRFDAEVVYHEQRLGWILSEISAGDADRLYLIDWVGDSLSSAIPEGSSWAVDEVILSRMGIITSKVGDADFVTVEELMRRPMIAFGGEDYARTVGEILDLDRADNIAISLSNERVIVKMLLESEDSYNIVDRFSNAFRGSDVEGIAFVPLKPAVFLSVGFVYLADSPHAATYRSYIAAWKRTLARAKRLCGLEGDATGRSAGAQVARGHA